MTVARVHETAIAVRVHTICVVELMISRLMRLLAGHSTGPELRLAAATAGAALVGVIARLIVVIVRLVRSLVVIAVVMLVVVVVIRVMVAGRVVVLDLRYGVRHVHGDVLYKMILAAECLRRFRVLERDERERPERLRNEHVRDLAELLEVAAQVLHREVLGYSADEDLAIELRTLVAELLFALAQWYSHVAPPAEDVVAFGDHTHLRIVVVEFHEAEALRLAALRVLFDLHHDCFAELLEILFKLVFGYLPRQAEHDQIGALIPGGRAFLVLLVILVQLAFVVFGWESGIGLELDGLNYRLFEMQLESRIASNDSPLGNTQK